MQISGNDLSENGPVTVTLDRTLRHLQRDALGAVGSDLTYVLDPSPTSHNVLSGEIRNGILMVKAGSIYVEGDMPFYAQIDLADTHMRMHSEASGGLLGYWGGYTDWHAWAYMHTARGVADGVGMYLALERLADADPDPVTGKNRSISTTWRMEAVPAYLATSDGHVVAQATNAALGGKVEAVAAAESRAANTAPVTP